MAAYDYEKQLAEMYLGNAPDGKTADQRLAGDTLGDAAKPATDDLATAAGAAPVSGAELAAKFQHVANTGGGGLAEIGRGIKSIGTTPLPTGGGGLAEIGRGIETALGGTPQVPGATTTPGSPDFAAPTNTPPAPPPVPAPTVTSTPPAPPQPPPAPVPPAPAPQGGGQTPGMQQQAQQDLTLGRAGLNQKAIIQGEEAEEAAPRLNKNADMLQAQIERVDKLQAQVESHVQDQLQRYQTIANDYMTSHVDPAQWFSTRDFAGKAAAAFAMAAGSFGGALTGQGNKPMDMIGDMVAANIQEQKDAIERKKAGGNMMLDLAKQYQAAGADARTALTVAQTTMQAYAGQYVKDIAMKYGVSAAQADEYIASSKLGDEMRKSTSESVHNMASAGLESAQAAQTRYQTETSKEINKQFGIHPAGYLPLPGATAPNGQPQYVPEKDRDKIVEADAAYDETASALKGYIAALNSPAGVMAGKREERAGIAKTAVSKYLGAVKGATTPNDKENAISEIVDPGYFRNKFMGAEAKEKAEDALKALNSMHGRFRGAYGIGSSASPLREKPRG